MSESPHCCIIAEAGVNHNGSLEMALRLIDIAADAGANIVKFQTFKSDLLVTKNAPKANYQVKNTRDNSSQHEMLRALELDSETHHRLLNHCSHREIEFLSTPFDEVSLGFLHEELGVKRIKLGSGELTNAPLLMAAGRTGKPTILSTGMGTMLEVETALGPLAFGYLNREAEPTESAVAAAFADLKGKAILKKMTTLLHCTTAYPTPPCDANLRAMETMRDTLEVPVGYSDHTEGIEIAIAAAALGASVIEKHITLDRTLPGPDHRASIEPDELKNMVSAIHAVTEALGDGKKLPKDSEIPNIGVARKSLVAVAPIKSGELFTVDNLGIKRPGSGLSPFAYWGKLGTHADRDYEVDDIVR